MDLGCWLNLISPDGPCFDLATLPIPGSPMGLSMIEALVEEKVKRRDGIRVLEIGSFCGISTIAWGRALERNRSPRLRDLLRRPLVPFGGPSIRTGHGRGCPRARHVQSRDLQI